MESDKTQISITWMLTVVCLKLNEKAKLFLRGKRNHKNVCICDNQNKKQLHVQGIHQKLMFLYHIIHWVFKNSFDTATDRYSDINLLFGHADGMVFPTTREVSTASFSNRMGLYFFHFYHTVQRFFHEYPAQC